MTAAVLPDRPIARSEFTGAGGRATMLRPDHDFPTRFGMLAALVLERPHAEAWLVTAVRHHAPGPLCPHTHVIGFHPTVTADVDEVAALLSEPDPNALLVVRSRCRAILDIACDHDRRAMAAVIAFGVRWAAGGLPVPRTEHEGLLACPVWVDVINAGIRDDLFRAKVKADIPGSVDLCAFGVRHVQFRYEGPHAA